MKRFCRAAVMAVIATLLIAMPVWAMYYAYIYIEETAGNSYSDLPLMVSANVSQLVAGQYISSTGLDTRVLTGDGYPLPHMLASDRILFVSDLEAYEDKTLIFYTGASSLSSFPIIVGHGGNITTPDSPGLEPTWVFQFLASGYFDSSAGVDKNIMYKEDAFRVYISGANTLRVAALETGGGEQWALEDTGFNTGVHSAYTVTDGLAAYLYVDDFDLPEDTVNLFDTNTVQTHTADRSGGRCFYAAGRYWIIYYYNATSFRYITSTDGNSWTGETTIDIADIGGGEEIQSSTTWDAKFRDGYLHIAYSSDYADGSDRLMYRRGAPQAGGTITWSAVWQTAMTLGTTSGYLFGTPYVAIDSDGYPTILFGWMRNWTTSQWIVESSTNDGTFTSAGEWQMFSNRHAPIDIIHFPDSNEMAVVAVEYDSGNGYEDTWFRYFDGSSWSGPVSIASYVGDFRYCFNSMTADDDGNLYVGWGTATNYLTIRSASGVWQKIALDAPGSSYDGVKVCYNENNGVVYMLYITPGTPNYVTARTLDTNEWVLSTPVTLTQLYGYHIRGTPPYGDHIGLVMTDGGVTYHSYVDLSVYDWNDNGNDWYWMQNNVMPYADYLMMGIDGTWQLEYQPATIIQGTTLPDVSTEGDHDGTITWGSNPDGVDVSISGLLTDETEDQYDYAPYIDLGGQDIIQPEPATLTGDIDMTKLARNPFRPLALAIAGVGGFSERLAWLGMGWIALIIAMLIVHLGLESRPGEQPEHFILTTVTGLGLSILFYVTGSFPLWPVILLSFGFIASIVYERMPNL